MCWGNVDTQRIPNEQQIEAMLTDRELLSRYQQLDMDLNFNETMGSAEDRRGTCR